MSLKVWLPLDGDLRNLGTSGIEITNDGVTIDNAGKIGKCMKITEQKELSYTPDFNNNSYSFGGWFKFNKDEINTVLQSKTYSNTASAATGNLIGNTSYGGLGLIWASNNMYSSNKVFSSMVIFSTLRTATVNQSTSSFTVDFDTWIHIIFSWDSINKTLSLYKNGILVNKKTVGNFSDGVSRSLKINYQSIYGGNGPSAAIPFRLNDVRIYDHCLSAAEVHEIAQGLVLHYKLNGEEFGTENILKNSKLDGNWEYPTSSYSDKYSPTTTIIPTASQYTLSFEAKSTVNGDKIRTHFYSPNTTTTCVSNQGITKTAVDGHMSFTLTTNWEKYWVIYTQTETTTTKKIICPRLVSGEGSGIVSVKNVKLEEGNKATNWCPNIEDNLYNILGLNNNIITDSSGYGHNGIINDTTLKFVQDSARYALCMINAQSNDSNIYPFYGECNIPESSEITFTWWMKPTSLGKQTSGIFSTSNLTSPTDYSTTAANMRDSCFDCCNTEGICVRLNVASFITLNEWHHYALTYNGTNLSFYKDGELKTTTTQTGSLKAFKYIFPFYSQAGGVHRTTSGYLSDFRIYCTPLLDTDIKLLYNMSSRIDNLGGVHSFELEETPQNKITKMGILKNNVIESYLTLPDNSYWKLILYHYVDNGNNLFTSSNATDCNDFGLYSKLKYIDNYTYNGKYEFYVIQDGKEFRWTQTSQPTASSITGFTVVDGYNNPVKGLAKGNQSYTYIGYGTWWGACGSWTKYTLGEKTGIPGFGPSTVEGICEKYLALYVRIEKNNISFTDGFVEATEFIEM